MFVFSGDFLFETGLLPLGAPVGFLRKSRSQVIQLVLVDLKNKPC